MCGIVGVVGHSEAAPLLLGGLRRLEYRGYDSAGIATLINGHIGRRRAEGKLKNLAAVLKADPLAGTTGIGHTRWATHGAPTVDNAHPHATSRVAVVHNGIIENHLTLRAELEAKGQSFSTETDTEVVAQLVDYLLQQGMAPIEAASQAFTRLEGAYALALIFAGHQDLVIGAQSGAPLAVGYGAEEMYLGSDALALAPLTREIAYLEDGDWVVVTSKGAVFHNRTGAEVTRQKKLTALTGAAIGKGNFRHFMEKELHEHPVVIGDVLHRMLEAETPRLPALPFDLAGIQRITMSACGSAFYAGLTAKFWLENLARVPVEADVASEFRYRAPPLDAGGLGLLVSQSGETADTLAALRYMKAEGQKILSVLNVPESTMARESHAILETIAGPEIGVASTKAFTAQLTVLAVFALALAQAKGQQSPAEISRLAASLLEVPARAAEILGNDAPIRRLAERIAEARDVLYLGRGGCFPIAMEGALKLKEISYIHAEGYAAGEMKHGPIALIDKSVPVIAICPSGPLFEKTASNLQEAAARGGQIVVFSDEEGASKLAPIAAETILLPSIDPFAAPILLAIPVQMLAYHVAVLKGTDVDQPRNLAKSVTVE
ncbi:glutamine--fructose-6-phosphate transaminase (isomerizing) [Acidocella aminolytica]|uniref:Glutamine--fructose-6-phosphate aminotransferase [isomerizing] n=1 Tax=Acidocella aminolytica 101 = DSM 11237 TaxID=1120923 RepID=A0A0D6PB80_9PROT|nr:glutamine--fructose-6-phosphate transaminase (isomerizing) [Acidocella aminolytica]GAN78922.1 glucosamine--fructose-6-phosphate aminotransferase [Acidocella aminolytica 101 = DSM 11237]GBQ42223.1 glucosamine--fructose-6-phosphate aminotransferase [Acidocella aminolytica 101 = DSM 11237]SHE99328.1 glutamine--fructose-6-phosphate transaminase [Acidocella aminolytica 101 = DSM 11237]